MSFTCEAGYPQTDRECAWCGASREQSCRRPPPDPRLAEINKLRAELAEAKKPDCRTCKKASERMNGGFGCLVVGQCVNADRYEHLPPVRLWRVTP